jgi:hypothetical protein
MNTSGTTLYAGEPVEATPSFDGDDRIGAPEMGEECLQQAAQGKNRPDFDQYLSNSSAL